MHFVSLKDTLEADCIEFYRNKFPTAFKKAPTDEEEEGQTEWISPAHEKAFKNFDTQMAKIVKEKNNISLLQTLLTYKEYILELPISVKKSECTMQRFFLYLLPVVSKSLEKNEKQTINLFVEFVDLLASSEVGLSAKVTSLLHMFNALQKGLKAYVFETMVVLCQKEGQLDILVQKARNIEADSATWSLTTDERKNLFYNVSKSLDSAQDEGAFQVLLAYLRQFENDKNMASVENEARRCVILAIKSGSVINFEELLELKTIKALEAKHQDVFKFLNLFTQTDAKNFKQALSGFTKLMSDEGLTTEEVIQKKTYVQICSLSTDKTNFKYDELAELLNISEEQVEEWAIEAISRKIIDAKIDQQKQEIVIKSHQLREIKKQEWIQIQNKVRLWKEKFQRMHEVLAASSQLVSQAK